MPSAVRRSRSRVGFLGRGALSGLSIFSGFVFFFRVLGPAAISCVCFLFLFVYALFGGESKSIGESCFSGLEEFARNVSFPLGESDETLKIRNSILGDSYVWLVDFTPSKNSDYYLLRKLRTGKYCPVLKTKGYEIKERKRGSRETVTVKVRGSGTISALELSYVLDRDETSFRLYSCAEIRIVRSGNARKFRIDCSDPIFDF
ncbi:hypothetical protein EHQ12_06445 [Leptospira gomenensis]|uniref:Uncharacterized protein n=1 Tax=Leptospira gomenensis TaxID=2484974 RepID=A0A5F1Y6Z9_9LEPT|nr:hypothetical protein [Leptospira gomenensis]TGK28822.1 hypothetical protein EHQ17_17325 [Leptospira gomenensis]TGK40972.1 hypothetical protein EHQ12_06445 [Leptospira gomenensis]TGK46176.1 hypothetical protein EHQ07_06955 [Leptospira gomenensis]